MGIQVRQAERTLTTYPQRIHLLHRVLGFLAFNALVFLLVGWLVVFLFRLFAFTPIAGRGFTLFVGLFFLFPCPGVLLCLPALCWRPLNAMQVWLSSQPVLTITD